MEQSMITPLVKEAVEAIKTAIQQTRYNVMRHANKELLSLYYGVGGYLSQQVSVAKWGDKVLDSISDQLQQEMPGLRGFSKGNIKKMRKFYEEWMPIFGSLSTNQNDPISIVSDPINTFSDPIKQQNMPEAIERAKRLEEYKNPSTSVYRLIEAMERR